MATEEMRFLHGFIDGRTEGYAQVLVHVLTDRFGSLPERVSDLVYDAARQVDVDHLKTWMARTVTAKALDQVFDLLPPACPGARLRRASRRCVLRGVFA